MDAHPIPQNVSSFQFRLIGDMTLKQFLYLAIGVGLGYLLVVFLGNVYPIIAWPLGIFFAGLGAAFAFLPIGSRPLDYWLKAFLKAIYSPTKRVWRKEGKNYQEDPLFQSRYVTYLSAIQPTVVPEPETGVQSKADTQAQASPSIPPAKPSAPPPGLQPIPKLSPTSSPAPASTELPSSEELKKTVDLAKQAQNLQMQIIQTERMLSQIRTEAKQPSPIPIDYTSEVSTILTNLQRLVAEASQIKQQLQTVTNAEEEKAKQQKTVLPSIIRVAPTKPKPQQIALTTFPNVISGIIKDLNGNFLEGVIAVIHDKEGLPVRALKTNKLGQFTGSTPLPNGIYTLEMEKENYTFDVLQIELKGDVLSPILITAKQ